MRATMLVVSDCRGVFVCVQPCINSLANTGAEARRHGSGVNPHTETHREVDADQLSCRHGGSRFKKTYLYHSYSTSNKRYCRRSGSHKTGSSVINNNSLCF